MSNDINPSIETLPVEILHRIFDNLNTETILFSIRPVSRLFRSIAITYDRYDLDLKLISKPNFYVLCRLINPQNVISLTILNDNNTLDQIDLFISHFDLKKFIRIRSLNLRNINESQLNIILKRINLDKLISFSFEINENHNTYVETTTNLLSSIISQSTLHRLEFNIENKRIRNISLPMNCTIQYLIINNHIDINNLCTIFQSSPHLNTLNMQYIPTDMIENISTKCLQQITSLNIKDIYATIDQYESFLLLTPFLRHLELIGGKQMLNGKRWEQFILKNLSQLNKFEFYFTETRSTKQTFLDLDLIMISYQTLFWLEQKKWFVICECDTINYKRKNQTIILYTSPKCISSIYYIPKSERFALSTYPSMMNNDLSIMNNVKSLTFDLNKALAYDIQEKISTTTNYPLFPKVTEIYLDFSAYCSSLSLSSLTIFINISQIVQMELSIKYYDNYSQNIWMDINNFMKQTHNLSSLIIHNRIYLRKFCRTTNNIFTILPQHVKYLEISIDDLDQIKMIFKRCENLSLIKFNIKDRQFSEKIIEWFDYNTINSTCKNTRHAVSIWLGKKIF